ncbi:hypothetical protein [Brassicibacter mesophilus]|uniref:hypothetical protein n=1 Tax=Brassicibacter mesophilus TaxID=745119 RepID=UPI003D1B0386
MNHDYNYDYNYEIQNIDDQEYLCPRCGYRHRYSCPRCGYCPSTGYGSGYGYCPRYGYRPGYGPWWRY